MFRKFVLKHQRLFYRLLEILPGFFSWNVIFFPYWGIFIVPNAVAYFILSYNIYWFYQSLQIALTGIIAHYRIQASMTYDWVKDLTSFPDWKKIRNVIIVTTYKEPLHILDRTFESIAAQTLPQEQIYVVLATEKKEPEEDRLAKISELKKKYSNKIGKFYVTVHELSPGEVAGKSSNERYAAIWFKENVIDKEGLDINYFTVTSCDADHVFHHNHFAALTYKFLDDPQRYLKFWQPAVLFYNNIWRVPALIRVPNVLGSIFAISQLPRRDRLISHANYSLSYKLLDEIGYWDADKIPEDWGIFFKAYYKKRGEIEVEPNYLPVYADAPESNTFKKTLQNMYNQRKRWAWGVSDDPWIIKNYFFTPGVPFLKKTLRILYVIQSHFLWPVHWFAITIGLQLPALLNPRFARTTLGHTVPRLSSIILTIALIFLVVMLILDRIYRPKRPEGVPAWRALIGPIEFVLMPVVGFFFSALPGIDAHTRLMLGKYIEYKVTEKV